MAVYDPATYEQEIEHNLRWNMVANALDGAFFWFALTFASSSTILPVYVSTLTDSKVAIGLLATMASMGWLVPQLFTAPLVERLPRKKPFFIWISLGMERVAFLFMAIITYFLSKSNPGLALVLFFVTYAWHAFGAGVIATAWQEMVAKVIPVRVRGRFFGFTNFLGAAMGLPGAIVATAILSIYPYPVNFALCFLITFVGVLLSWIAVAQTREPPGPTRESHETPLVYLRRLGQIIRTDRNFARFLSSRVVGAIGSMFVGFIAVAAIQRFDLPDEVAGQFTSFMMGGNLVANILFGPIADRWGHKIVLEIGALCNAGSALLVLLAPAPTWVFLAFALQGAVSATYLLSGMSIAFEFSEPDVRPTYIGLASTISGVFSGIAPLLGGTLAAVMGYSGLFVVGTVIVAISWAMMRWWVVDPRFARRET
jgi:MFS family permease